MGPTNVPLRLRRVLLSGVLGLVLLIPASVVPGPGSAATCAAATTHRVAVVVQHLDGATLSRCVSFTADSITGEQALAGSHIQAGLLPSGGFGNAVCQLDGEPTSYPPSCWTGSSPFWALFVARGGGWSYSSVGVSSIVLHDGDSVGFRYQSQSTHAPPSIAGNCPSPTPTPAPATPRPTPRPTATPIVAPTPAPTHPSPPAPPGPAGSSSAATTGSLPAPSPSGGGGVALATDPAGGSPTPGDAAVTASVSTTPDAALAASAGTTGGGPPIGLVLAGVAALAFAALGAFQLRRTSLHLRRPR